LVVLLQRVFERSMSRTGPGMDTGSREENASESKAVRRRRCSPLRLRRSRGRGQHDDIQHEVLLVVLVSKRRLWVLQGTRIALDQHGIAAAIRALPVAVAVKCHWPHMFSRRARKQSYRNLIKTQASRCACSSTRRF